MKILILEDDERVLEALELLIEEIEPEIEVICTHNIKEAVVLTLSRKPDLILTDYRLAGEETGLMLIDFLKSVKNKTPIVLMSGFFEEDFKAPESVTLLNKPFSFDELEKLINSHC